jgi:hypothetical protein
VFANYRNRRRTFKRKRQDVAFKNEGIERHFVSSYLWVNLIAVINQRSLASVCIDGRGKEGGGDTTSRSIREGLLLQEL